jgi:outer membrane cobalamin receptor
LLFSLNNKGNEWCIAAWKWEFLGKPEAEKSYGHIFKQPNFLEMPYVTGL